MQTQLTTDVQALSLFFTDDVYLVPEPKNIPVASAPVTFKYLGSNKRKILILVNDEEHEVSDEQGRELLRKIVKSVNLTSVDFALLNYAAHKAVGFSELAAHFDPVIAFVFGVRPQELGLRDHPEHVVVSEGAVKLIFSAELRKLETDQQAKKILWGSLRQLDL